MDIRSDEDNSAAINTTPAREWYWVLDLWNPRVAALNAQVWVKIIYDLEFFDTKNVAHG